MQGLIVRPSLERYLAVSDEVLNLFSNFLTIWNERTSTDIDVIEARKIFSFMVREDKKRPEPHIGDVLSFSRHSWVVGEYASDLARKLSDKGFETEVGLSPKEIEYAGGSHDIAKMFLMGNYQYAHEHAAYLLLRDNGCESLASLSQPHQPGEETVLRMLHEAGDFLDITSEEFCGNRRYPFASDLIILSDMSCGLGYDGALARMTDIKARYSPSTHLVIGINAPEGGGKRVLAIEEKVNQLLT
jgi:hypothetical protein